MEKELEQNLEEIFKNKVKIRDINKCMGCYFFIENGDGTFCCKNASHFFGHPWSFESRHPLKAEWFEKAEINFQYRELCRQLDDNCDNEQKS